MKVVFGGSFNPPTKAHREIIKYLADHYDEVVLVPNGDHYHYQQKNLISFHHRFKMLEIMIRNIAGNITISDYEMLKPDFKGTVQMLEDMEHPLFAIGADSLASIRQWIHHEDLIKDNHFLVFPRSNICVKDLLEHDPLLHQYAHHFELVPDFPELSVSSSAFRINRDASNLSFDIIDYIRKYHLYEVN